MEVASFREHQLLRCTPNFKSCQTKVYVITYMHNVISTPNLLQGKSSNMHKNLGYLFQFRLLEFKKYSKAFPFMAYHSR